MLKSILTTALRNIFRNRTFSLINLIGLSVSMSLALLVIQVISEQYSYDNFHKDSDRIHRVNTRAIRVSGDTEDYASTPLPIGRVLKEEYSFAEEVVRVNRGFDGDVVYGNVNVPVSGLLVDQAFLQVFNFPLEKGNPATALSDPKSIVLTTETAKKIFGDQEPLGQTVSVAGFGEFIVSGVLKPIAEKTHFTFEMLGSMNALPSFEQLGIFSPMQDNWGNYYSNHVYLKLKEGKSVDEVKDAFQQVASKYYKGHQYETRDKAYSFFLLSLNEITPGPAMSNQMGTGMPEILIIFLSVLVGLVMLMACFNYTNLMIAKSLTRAKEIGVRKVVGAQRFQVFVQFVGEAVVFSCIALCFSYLLLQILKPAYKQLNMAQEFSMVLNENYALYIYFVLFAIAIGVVAGMLPAGYLSSFKPVRVLKDRGTLKVYSRLAFRKILIVTQFTLSIAFIIVVLVIYNQVTYMVTTDYGINDQNILNVRLQGLEHEKLAQELASVPGVISVGGVSHQLGTWSDRNSDYKRARQDESFVMRDFMVDDVYVKNLDLVFLSGSNFDANEQGNFEKHVILNEQALSLFGFKNPMEAVGRSIYTNDSIMLSVIGVVKDFHFRPLSYQIGPVAFRYDKRELGFLSAKITAGRKEEVVLALEAVWKKLDPIHPLEWKMMDEEIDEAYTQAGFFDILKIVGYISFVAIVLACLGMLGMAMYSTQTRMKEIGVRKVMGATSKQLVFMLSRSFLLLIVIAAIIGIPIGYFFGDLFLSNYAYKIDITIWLLLGSILIVTVLGIVTIGSQTYKAASSDPVKSLRYE